MCVVQVVTYLVHVRQNSAVSKPKEVEASRAAAGDNVCKTFERKSGSLVTTHTHTHIMRRHVATEPASCERGGEIKRREPRKSLESNRTESLKHALLLYPRFTCKSRPVVALCIRTKHSPLISACLCPSSSSALDETPVIISFSSSTSSTPSPTELAVSSPPRPSPDSNVSGDSPAATTPPAAPSAPPAGCKKKKVPY